MTFLVDNPNSVSARGRLTAMAILVHAAATATKAVVIGKASFTASAMASVKVTATLSKTARSYLKTHRSLKARVKLVLAAAGISRTTSQPVVIKVFKAKHS